MNFPYKLIDLTHTLDSSIPTWNGSFSDIKDFNMLTLHESIMLIRHQPIKALLLKAHFSFDPLFFYILSAGPNI